jgi:transposase
MLNPPPWDKTLYAQRHHIENLFGRLKDQARIALRRDKTRRSWVGFAHLAATLINLRLAKFSHRA